MGITRAYLILLPLLLLMGCNSSQVAVSSGSSVTEIHPCTLDPDPLSSGFHRGNGLLSDPYGICTAAQLNSIGDNFLDKHFEVLQDIDLTSVANFNIIGSGPADEFSGTFDGGGYEISNLTLSLSPTLYYGMFGSVTNTGKISNVRLVNVNIDDTANPGIVAGALVGYTEGEVTNSSSSGVVTGSSTVGGLVGSAENGALISGSSSSATIDGWYRGGGLLGFLYESSVEDSFATGNVTSERYTGGLIGAAESFATAVTITRSYATGAVTGQVTGFGYKAGGLIGEVSTDSLDLMITLSYATGNVSGEDEVGGFIGSAGGWGGGRIIVGHSFSRGAVHTHTGSVGGFAGSVTDVYFRSSYSAGIVSGDIGTTNLGGVVGVSSNALYNGFYYCDGFINAGDADGSVPGAIAGTNGQTRADMKNQGRYAGWDFTTIWGMDPLINDGYPYLR